MKFEETPKGTQCQAPHNCDYPHCSTQPCMYLAKAGEKDCKALKELEAGE